MREVVGSVLRVKPDSLRDDQPLTDLGLDSLMGVEIENSLEAAIGVALPPTSLMRARTIGQIAALIGRAHGRRGTGGRPVFTRSAGSNRSRLRRRGERDRSRRASERRHRPPARRMPGKIP